MYCHIPLQLRLIDRCSTDYRDLLHEQDYSEGISGIDAVAADSDYLIGVMWPSGPSWGAVRLRLRCPRRQPSDMADQPSIKPDARQLVDSLPESATWDDLAYEIYVRQSIDAGVADTDAGRIVEHDDAMARIRSRIRRAS